MSLKDSCSAFVKKISNVHRSNGQQNIFVFTMPRSGSTWLMEILSKEQGFKSCNEPFYLRSALVRKYSKLNNPEDVHDPKKLVLIEKYFQSFCDGKLGFMNPNPFSDGYRFFTNRIVFKIIHGGEELIDWFKDKFNGRIIFLIRHPIAVSVSRKVLPRTEAMLTSSYAKNFTASQISLGKNILESGDFFEKAILDWCLQNYVPLKNRKSDWLFLTYEQLVVEPEKALNYLKAKLELKNTQKMFDSLNKPSGVLRLSDAETQGLLQDKTADREVLVSKWRKKVTPEMEARCWEILAAFEIDVYGPDSIMPKSDYLI